jgi:hypothetical protein
MGKTRDEFRIFAGRSVREQSVTKPRGRCEDNINMDLREEVCVLRIRGV